eukprot:1299960-Ditylum_brightwellii.AAC.1
MEWSNKLSSANQVEAIAIQASVALGFCPNILCQTHSYMALKGGATWLLSAMRICPLVVHPGQSFCSGD